VISDSANIMYCVVSTNSAMSEKIKGGIIEKTSVIKLKQFAISQSPKISY
jgi:hypothetical protein